MCHTANVRGMMIEAANANGTVCVVVAVVSVVLFHVVALWFFPNGDDDDNNIKSLFSYC